MQGAFRAMYAFNLYNMQCKVCIPFTTLTVQGMHYNTHSAMHTSPPQYLTCMHAHDITYSDIPACPIHFVVMVL